MVTPIKVGDKGPNFMLPDADLKMRSLSDFLGRKVVLAFLLELSPLFAQRRCALSEIPWHD